MKPSCPAYHTFEIHLKHIFGNGLDFANYDQGKAGGHGNQIKFTLRVSGFASNRSTEERDFL